MRDPGVIEPATLGSGGLCFNHYAVDLGKLFIAVSVAINLQNFTFNL